MTLHELQTERRSFDDEFWQHKENIDVWTRHILFHLQKLVGKVSGYVEQREHKVDVSTDQLKSEVIPDLLGYALQLGNLFEADVEELYRQRLDAVRSRAGT